jgi:hypothetical protein
VDGKVLQATDVTGGSFSLLLFAMIGTGVLMFVGTGWVARRWKLAVALGGVVALVAALYYAQARDIWQVSAGQMPVIYRYVDWLIGAPLQVATVYFFVAALAPVPVGLFWRLVVVAAGMVLTRYMGEVGYMNATLGFLIGIIGWLYVLGELFFGRLSEVAAKSKNEAAQVGLFWLPDRDGRLGDISAVLLRRELCGWRRRGKAQHHLQSGRSRKPGGLRPRRTDVSAARRARRPMNMEATAWTLRGVWA